jgi:phosphoglycerate dehydrogenase-like enzyme
VVNVLPANGETAHYFNAARINRMKSGAYFYNVGRGSTVDQQALRAALADGRLAGAYLDVTDPEPLPPDHPLWQTPNCWITPHAAGGHVGESARHVRHFLDNLARFTGGQPLRDIAIR